MVRKLFSARSGGKDDKRLGPDFSDVDSAEKAEALFREGTLEKLYLLPIAYGGQDIPQNVVYVPVGIGDMKAQIDSTIGKLVADGLVTQYAATPEYCGRSFIPCRIIIKAWNPREFKGEVKVW